MKQLGVLLENVGASQISFFVISELNKFVETNSNVEPIVFYEEVQKNCLPTNFAVMEMQEAWGCTGTVIATSVSTAKSLSEFPSIIKKFFYVWDTEWIRNSIYKNTYENYAKIYTNENISLIARSDSHKLLIENAFNREVEHVIGDFNISSILEVIK